jgi:hypothetical protein
LLFLPQRLAGKVRFTPYVIARPPNAGEATTKRKKTERLETAPTKIVFRYTGSQPAIDIKKRIVVVKLA